MYKPNNSVTGEEDEDNIGKIVPSPREADPRHLCSFSRHMPVIFCRVSNHLHHEGKGQEKRRDWEDKKELTCMPSTAGQVCALTRTRFKIIASEGHSLYLE